MVECTSWDYSGMEQYSLPLEIHLVGGCLCKPDALTVFLFSDGLTLVIQPIAKS